MVKRFTGATWDSHPVVESLQEYNKKQANFSNELLTCDEVERAS